MFKISYSKLNSADVLFITNNNHRSFFCQEEKQRRNITKTRGLSLEIIFYYKGYIKRKSVLVDRNNIRFKKYMDYHWNRDS